MFIVGFVIAGLLGVGINLLSDSWASSIPSVVLVLGGAGLSAIVASLTTWAALRDRRDAARAKRDADRSIPLGSRNPAATHDDLRIEAVREIPGEAELLVQEVANLEFDAHSILSSTVGERRRTIFDLRAELAGTGLWTPSDVEDFDRVVRVRNAIVHGDRYSDKEASNALKTLERLRSRLRSKG